jgi:signal transduction histidine kinase/CheY-like chemotaxis protein
MLKSAARAGHDVRDPGLVLRVQVQVLYAALACLSGVIYACAEGTRNSVLLTTLFVGLSAGSALLLVALRFTGRLRAVAHSSLAIAFASLCVSTYWTGGLRLTNVCPFFMTTVAAIFLLSWEGLGWAILSIVVPIGFEVAGGLGYRFPDLIPPEARASDALITWLLAIVFVLLFVLYYEAARVAAMRVRAQAEAARSQFLAHVSHELRTPLHAIMGMTHQAQRAKLPADARDALRTVQQNADDLVALINDLMLLAVMERDRFTLQPHDFDPCAEAERVANSLRLRCQEKGLAFSLSVSPTAPRWVYGDGDRLRQVLGNLGSNAVRYTDQGSIELSVDRADVESDAMGCRFAVRDTGIGIGPEDQQQIFEPFGRVATDRKGLGLGLHITHEIVTAMKGRVHVTSQPGAGSTFSVVVPFQPPHGERPSLDPSAPSTSADAPSLRVLVVDDDEVNVRMATTMLQELGHETLVARSGEQAIDRWESEQPDAILMDIQMPGMDGEEATRRIRSREQARGGAAVPIIALTGHGTPEHRDQYLDAGATHCLFKPFRLEEIQAALGTVAVKLVDARSSREA